MNEYTFRNKFTTSPSDLHPGDCFILKIVAVVGYRNDWAAYVAPTDYSDLEVVTNGDKISYEQASALFPLMDWGGLTYRR